MFNWDLLVPYSYGSQYVTLRQLEQIMLRDYHPEYVRRFIGWLHYKNGNVGAGGLSRTEQPTGPTFAASLLVSFHWAGQTYNDGVTAACAVDTVFRDGPDAGTAHDGIAWAEVPIQGSAAAVTWGLHANVGIPGKGESWHIQPIEIDGHGSWVTAGRAAPARNYPIPAEHDPYAQTAPPIVTTPTPTRKQTDMIVLDLNPNTNWWVAMLLAGDELTHLVNGHHVSVLERGGVARVPLGTPQTSGELELEGVLLSIGTTNASPFAPGKPSHNQRLHDLWLAASDSVQV